MNFLLINHEYPPIGGGAATACRSIAENLRSLGHEVVVLTSSYDDLPRLTKESGVAIRRIPCRRKRADRSNLFEMFTFMVVALFWLPFILARLRLQGIIAFFTLPAGVIALLYKALTGTPYVISLRGGDVPGLVPQMDAVHRCVAPLRRLILRHARAVAANSEGLRKLSETSDPSPVHVIPNGVDTELFRPAPAGSAAAAISRTLRLLFVGRFHEQKNLEFLLRQVAHFPSRNVELHLVGDGPQRDRLRELAQELGITKAITWHGWIGREKLPEIYQSADCLINPSLYEGMPNAVLEAMACGLPVIASDIPGNRELVLPAQTGLLFDLGNPEELISAIRKLEDVEFRRQMATRARARALTEFSWRTVAETYARLFRKDMSLPAEIQEFAV